MVLPLTQEHFRKYNFGGEKSHQESVADIYFTEY